MTWRQGIVTPCNNSYYSTNYNFLTKLHAGRHSHLPANEHTTYQDYELYVTIKNSYMFLLRRAILREPQIQRRLAEDGVWAPKYVGFKKMYVLL